MVYSIYSIKIRSILPFHLFVCHGMGPAVMERRIIKNASQEASRAFYGVILSNTRRQASSALLNGRLNQRVLNVRSNGKSRYSDFKL